jgi:hypothetical protein
VEVETVSCMTRRVDRIRPKSIRGLVFIKHDSYHLHESTVLRFVHPILLMSIRGQKLMLDTLFIKIIFHLSVLKLGDIVTSNSLNFSIKFILCSLQ